MQPSRFTRSEFNWRGGLFLMTYHVLLLISLPVYLLYTDPPLGLIAATVVLWAVAALGITAGYHRLFSHKTFRSHWFLESLLIAMGTLATQGSVLQWVFSHRRHHRYVDTDRDPYETPRGFWHSHLLWMFRREHDFNLEEVSDLAQNRLVLFQHRHYGAALAVVNLVPVLLLGWFFQDFWGAIVLALLTRMFLVHHCTWFINSLAHIWGDKPYSTEHSAVNNWILAFLTFGEGYHNYHHTFAGDYRNGVKWYQFDPTKVLIWLAAKAGLASNLRTVGCASIKRKLIQADRKQMLAKIKAEKATVMAGLEAEIIRLSDSLGAKLKDWERRKRRLTSLKESKPESALTKRVRREVKLLRKSIRKEYRSWGRLCRQVLNGYTLDV